ncbi:hypothetical protein RFI_33634, partial [Reticulomyxa filosa]
TSLTNACEFLKSHHFLEIDVQRLVDNENELDHKICECERENAKLEENPDYIFNVLDAPKAAKMLLYVKTCKDTVFFAGVTAILSSRSEVKEDEKKQTETSPAIPIRQEIINTLDLMEKFLQRYSIF